MPAIHTAMTVDQEGATHGDVMRHSKQLIDPSQSEIMKVVEKMAAKHPVGETFTIGDYGSADGCNSMELIRGIIGIIKRKCGNNKEIHVMYNDNPLNDFNAVFKRIEGIIPEPRSYLKDYDNVVVTASGTSFYNQCVPSKSVDLMLSFTATHYLSKPINLTDHLYRAFSTNKQEVDAISRQAAEDWHRFLLMRSMELKNGGWGIFSTISEFDDPVKTRNSFTPFLLDKNWTDMRQRGIITEEEFQRCCLPACCRTKKEIEEPLLTSRRLRDAGLRLDHVTSTVRSCPFTAELKEKRRLGIDGREIFARDYVIHHRTWSYGTFYGSLNTDRSPEERAKICSQFYDGIEKDARNYTVDEIKNDPLLSVVFVYNDNIKSRM